MRFAWVYTLLVGGPLLGLVVVLRVGDRLDAPSSVGGTWRLEPATATPLEIVQSGPVLELRWGGETGRGRLSGDELSGQLGPWRLDARRVGPGRLTGSLTPEEPAPVTTFVAVRERRSRAGGR